ncbi:hypothetical protein V1477_014995 [Vespula maculifrons]|uniref:Uncharacterized protein n=1 Tax=Vespula maculifrons TaxID=7453 RepID=A0ABD2BJ14_VESMC
MSRMPSMCVGRFQTSSSRQDQSDYLKVTDKSSIPRDRAAFRTRAVIVVNLSRTSSPSSTQYVHNNELELVIVHRLNEHRVERVNRRLSGHGRLDDWPVRCSRRDHKCNHSRATCGCRIESTLGLIQLCLSISMAASLDGPSPTKGRNECSRLRTLEIFPFVSEVIVRISNTNSPT